METLLLIGGLYLAYKMFGKKNTQGGNNDGPANADEELLNFLVSHNDDEELQNFFASQDGDEEWRNFLASHGYIVDDKEPEGVIPNGNTTIVKLVEFRYRKNSANYFDCKWIYSDGSIKTLYNQPSGYKTQYYLREALAAGAKISPESW